MHLGNGAITPECAVLTYGAAAAGLAWGGCILRSKTRSELQTIEKLQLAAALGCAVFATQAINVPVAPGMSAHLVGGALLAWILGPALGASTMMVVLTAQALLLGDGGIAALGANALNMALLPAAMVAMAKRVNPSITSLGLAACAAVLMGAVLIVLETAAFRPVAELTDWMGFATRMLLAHAWIGVLEGAMTVAIVAALARVASPVAQPSLRPAMIGLTVLLIAAALALPISSSLPDGYEAAAQASGMDWLLK